MSNEHSSRRTNPTRLTRSPESFDSLRARDAAAEILQSYEKLSWFSFHRCETIMQTRLHFQRVLAGLDQDTVTWKEDYTRHARPEDDTKSSRKGKDRVSLRADEGSGSASKPKQKSVTAAGERTAKETGS